MKKYFALFLVLAVLLMLPACSKRSGTTIAVVAQQSDDLFYLAARDGALQAGKDLGINVQWQTPDAVDAALQKEIMNDLMEQGVDGIAISCADGDALKNAIASAVSKGIAVSCFDMDSPGSRRSFYAGTENYKAGYTCGEYMVELFKNSGLEKVRVAQLEGIPGAVDIEARKQGFADAIAGSNVQVVYSFPCMNSIDEAVTGVEAYTRAAGGNIDAWFMAGGWPYCVTPDAMPELNSWKLADPKHKVITVDIFPETTPAFFELGVLDVAIGQSFYNMGYESVVNLYKLIEGEQLDAPIDEAIGCPFINTGVQIVTIDDYELIMGIQ